MMLRSSGLPYSLLVPVFILSGLLPETPSRLAPGSCGPESGRSTKASARRIDELVLAELNKNQLHMNALTNDATFVRRIYLDVVGRIPTVKEARSFLASTRADKREKLIDQLLDSPGHVSHMFNYWADILRVKTRLNNQVSGEPYMHWIKEAIASNKAYDEFVTELLTAEGAAHKRGNGATGYYLRDRGMPLDNMSNSIRIFLGTRLECAQCHNHPFDKWTQKQFYAMAAFTSGIRYSDDLNKSEGGKRIAALNKKLRRDKDRNAIRSLGRLLRPVRSGIAGSGTGLIRLPRDYKYDDARPRDVVTAKTMFGEDARLEVSNPQTTRQDKKGRGRRARPRRRARGRMRFKDINSRSAFAEWLTSAQNPRFSLVIANRMWKRVMGQGLVEPVDFMTDETEASNPELMRYLTDLMVEIDFDLKEFQRTLFNTRIYQSEAARVDPVAGEKFYFSGPLLRRMSGEQVWDSLLTLLIPDVDAKLQAPLSPRAENVYRGYEDFMAMSTKELEARVEKEALRYADPQKYRALQRKRREAQRQKQRLAGQKRAQANKKIQGLYRQLKKARRQRKKALEKEIWAKLEQLGATPEQRKKQRRRRRRRPQGRGLVRASDLSAPAPAGHLVRQFGQSDRDQIQTSHREANVPQVLALMNGFVETNILRPKQGVMMLAIEDARGSTAKIKSAYMSILTREPGSRELAMWQEDVKSLGSKAYSDIVWTLLNSHEFRFVQ